MSPYRLLPLLVLAGVVLGHEAVDNTTSASTEGIGFF